VNTAKTDLPIRAQDAHRTSRPNDTRNLGQRAHIGTYVLEAIDAQIAGSGAVA
jgi:hypothetical protein